MAEVRAVPVDGVRSQITADGRTGLLHFHRLRPDAHGVHELNLAAPVPILPYIAAAALGAMPQPEPGEGGRPTILIGARSVRPGLSPDGVIVLTIEMEMGASISFAIDGAQAESLQQTLSIALARRKAQALRLSAAARLPRKP
jgi:hypothetical protein